MAVTKAQFQNLADRLINDTFGDFKAPLVLTNAGTYDPRTGSTPGDTQTIEGIRLNYSQSQFDNVNIKIGDFKVIIEKQLLTIEVNSDSTSAVFDGVDIDIVGTTNDPADATIIFQAREK